MSDYWQEQFRIERDRHRKFSELERPDPIDFAEMEPPAVMEVDREIENEQRAIQEREAREATTTEFMDALDRLTRMRAEQIAQLPRNVNTTFTQDWNNANTTTITVGTTTNGLGNLWFTQGDTTTR